MAAASCNQARSKPLSKLILRDDPGGKALNDSDCVDRLKLEFKSVTGEEESRDSPCNSLIPIHKAVVACQPEGIRGGRIRGIRLAIREQILRTRQSGFDHGSIADAFQAAVLSD